MRTVVVHDVRTGPQVIVIDEFPYLVEQDPSLEIVVEPFGPHETAEMLDPPAADAIDAQLVLGGFPQITQEWRPEKENV